MSRVGKFFDVELKSVHLNWGREGESRKSNERNIYESYIPINIENARRFNILRGEVFDCISLDGYFEGKLKATGSQGEGNRFGKNFTKNGDMRALGYWLKDRNGVQPGTSVRIEFIEENKIYISILN